MKGTVQNRVAPLYPDIVSGLMFFVGFGVLVSVLSPRRADRKIPWHKKPFEDPHIAFSETVSENSSRALKNRDLTGN